MHIFSLFFTFSQFQRSFPSCFFAHIFFFSSPFSLNHNNFVIPHIIIILFHFNSNFMGLVTYKRSIGSRCPSRNCFPAGPGLHCHGWPSVSSARHVSITASHLLYRSKTGLDTSLLPSFPVQGAPL